MENNSSFWSNSSTIVPIPMICMMPPGGGRESFKKSRTVSLGLPTKSNKVMVTVRMDVRLLDRVGGTLVK
jgi:hypothetical protein